MISVISAVKGRYDLTLESFNSIWEQCSTSDNIEHLLLCDYDDMEMRSLLKKYQDDSKRLGRRVLFDVVRYPDNFSYRMRMMHMHYWNRMAMASKGDIVFGLTNDGIIKTKNYDLIFEHRVDEFERRYGHRVFYIMPNDGYSNEKRWEHAHHMYSGFIVLTAEAIKVFNGIAPDEISSRGGDQFVSRVFHESLVPAVIDLTDEVYIEQRSVQVGNYPSDNVQEELPILDTMRPTWPFYADILNGKMYYHYRLQTTILESLLRCRMHEVPSDIDFTEGDSKDLQYSRLLDQESDEFMKYHPEYQILPKQPTEKEIDDYNRHPV